MQQKIDHSTTDGTVREDSAVLQATGTLFRLETNWCCKFCNCWFVKKILDVTFECQLTINQFNFLFKKIKHVGWYCVVVLCICPPSHLLLPLTLPPCIHLPLFFVQLCTLYVGYQANEPPCISVFPKLSCFSFSISVFTFFVLCYIFPKLLVPSWS